MAEAIPRILWSEVEEYSERLFYWEFLVNSWLIPGPAILKQSDALDSVTEPRAPSLHDYGWLLEPDSLLEQ